MLLYGSHWGHARAEGGVGEHTEAFETQEGSKWALGTGERSSLTSSLQLDAVLLLASPPIRACGLNIVDDSHKRLKGHLDPASLAWLQQP